MEEVINQEAKTEPTLIDGANLAAEKLRLENERMERNIKDLQQLEAQRILGGRTSGAPQVEKPKEIDPREYAKNIIEGKIKYT